MLANELGHEFELTPVEDLGGRIHGRIQEDQFGLVREGGFERGPGKLPAGRLDADQLRHRAGPAHDRQIGVVERLDQDHLVARFDQSEQARRQGLGRPRRNQGLGLPVDVEPVEAFVMCRDRLAQVRHPHHRRVLIGPVIQGVVGRLPHVVGSVAVRKALAEIDAFMFDGQAGHDLEHSRPVTGQYGVGRFQGAPPPFPTQHPNWSARSRKS